MIWEQPGHHALGDSNIWRPRTQSTYAPSYYYASPPPTGPTKSFSSLGSYSSSESGNPLPVRGRRLRRFWWRTLALVLAPLTITAYFIFIWQYFLRTDGAVKYGNFNESWIFYSWFAVGVFGLSISRYGIIGVEAAMLQDPFWQTKSAMSLFMHSGATWAGAGGWVRCITESLRWKRSIAGRLWYLLSFITVSLFVGLPISGLSLEITDGYIYSAAAPMTIGRNWSDFHHRDTLQTEFRGFEAWRAGSSVTLPGIGLAYTPPYVQRSKYKFLDTVPNSLPLDHGIPELFLAPQADVPISGEAWGLRLSYNCSIVESASDLTILSQKASIPDWTPGAFLQYQSLEDGKDVYYFRTGTREPNNTMYVFNSTATEEDIDVRQAKRTRNIWAYGELAASRNAPSPWNDFRSGDGSGSSYESNDTFRAGVLEYVLWQVGLANNYKPAWGSLSIDEGFHPEISNVSVVDFDTSLDPSISGLASPFISGSNGSYSVNASYFSDPTNPARDPACADIFSTHISAKVRVVAEPIGVQCRHMSVLGTAQLDAKTTSFSNFTATPPPLFNGTDMDFRTTLFGGSAEQILAAHYFDIFPSTNSPPPINSATKLYYTSFVKPDMLLQSALRAYAMDAMQLMYDGLPGLNGAYLNPNLTSSRKGKVLELGIMPPLIPAIWLAVWAFVCALLGLGYGFRRRWSSSLDGYSLFRLGADFADEVRDVSSIGAFEECEKLWELPGFVGDARRGESVGYVSLVSRDEAADTGKLYV